MTHHKVILDLDPGIDDSLALILAVMATSIEILGVSIVSVSYTHLTLPTKRIV